MSDIKIGSTDVSDVRIGASGASKVYVGSNLVWTRTVVEQVPPLTASDQSEWIIVGVGASFSRVNGNNDFRLVSPGAGTSAASLDLWNYVSDGTTCDVSITLSDVSVGAGDVANMGLDNSSNFGVPNTPFPGSPFDNTETGVKTLTSQVIDSTRRYLNVSLGAGVDCEFTSIIVTIS